MAKIALSGSNPSLRPPTSRSAHLLPAPCLRAVLPVLLPIRSTGTLPAGGPAAFGASPAGIWVTGEGRAGCSHRSEHPPPTEPTAPGLAVVPARGCPSRVGAGIQPAASAKCHGPVTVSLRLPL